MRADERDHRLGRRACLGLDVPAQRSHDVARRAEVGEDPSREAERVDDVVGPLPAMDVEQPGGRGVRDLGHPDAGQPVPEQVGDQQEGPGGGQLGRSAIRRELVDRVERQELETGPGIELDRRHEGMNGGHSTLRPLIAVVVRVAEERAPLVEQAVVDRPRVEPDADQAARRPDRLAEAQQDLAVEAQDVPMEAVRQSDRLVGEAVDLGQLQVARPDPPDHHSPARRAEIDGRDEPADHRRKAAATPASTGMWSPVV